MNKLIYGFSQFYYLIFNGRETSLETRPEYKLKLVNVALLIEHDENSINCELEVL